MKRIMKLEERDEGGDLAEKRNEERKEDYATKSKVVCTLGKVLKKVWRIVMEKYFFCC